MSETALIEPAALSVTLPPTRAETEARRAAEAEAEAEAEVARLRALRAGQGDASINQ